MNMTRCDNCGTSERNDFLFHWWSLEPVNDDFVSFGSDTARVHHFCSLECLGAWANDSDRATE